MSSACTGACRACQSRSSFSDRAVDVLIVVGLPQGAGFGFFPGAALYAGWSLWLCRLRGEAAYSAAERKILPDN